MSKMDKVVSEFFPKINDKITYFEAYEVILDMEDSAPGSNGLTIAFFKKIFSYFLTGK